MASSQIEIQSDSTKESEPVVADPAQISTNTVTIDNIFTASQYGDLEKLRKFVEQDGASLSSPDNDGCYALHWAALNNHAEIAKYIIEHGGDVNAVNKFQMTALYFAASGGCISIANVLLQNGAQVEVATENGSRAVHVAAGNGHTSFLNHIVEKHNADFDVPNNDRQSPLHWASCNGQVDTITWLISKNACKKRQDIFGRTPLLSAGHIDAFMVLMDASTEEEIMIKDNEGNTAIQLSSILTSKALYEECKNSRICHFGNISEGYALMSLYPKSLGGYIIHESIVLNRIGGATGTNRPMIIAMQGNAYTGKSHIALDLALKIKCPIISLEDFLCATEPTDKRETLISKTFNIITEIVKMQIILGFSVIVDSPLSRLSHLQKLASLACAQSTKLLIIECKPKNEYAYQLRFEERGSEIYSSRWYKPGAVWPLPKAPRDYTDNDIPYGVSKLVVDTHDHYASCLLLRAILDVASCGYGHKTKFRDNWVFIHTDKKEQFTCPCPKCKLNRSYKDFNLHKFTFHDVRDHSDTVCGVCDFLVDGPRYTCMDCPLILHKSCAELARGGEEHFVPNSFPIFMSREPHLSYAFPVERPCAECRKDGKGFSCKCKHCLFESHLKSRLVPTIVRHKAHNDFLTLVLSSDVGDSMIRYICVACKKLGLCAAYILAPDGVYHPHCALLPASVHHSHGGHTHDLEMIINRVEKMEDYVCSVCPIKMDPSAWYYYCSECDISLHLECAFLDFDSGGPITEDRSFFL